MLTRVCVDNELTAKWLHRLRESASSNESREKHSQLTSLLDYYNRYSEGAENLEPIDWDHYSSNIHTPNVVDKMRHKYAEFMEAEFGVDGAIAKCGHRSEAMK